jgi:hypothetical protein
MSRFFLFVLLIAMSAFAQGESVSDYDRWMQAKAHRDSVRNAEMFYKNAVPFNFLVGMTMNVGLKVKNTETQLPRYEKVAGLSFLRARCFRRGRLFNGLC